MQTTPCDGSTLLYFDLTEQVPNEWDGVIMRRIGGEYVVHFVKYEAFEQGTYTKVLQRAIDEFDKRTARLVKSFTDRKADMITSGSSI